MNTQSSPLRALVGLRVDHIGRARPILHERGWKRVHVAENRYGFMYIKRDVTLGEFLDPTWYAELIDAGLEGIAFWVPPLEQRATTWKLHDFHVVLKNNNNKPKTNYEPPSYYQRKNPVAGRA